MEKERNGSIERKTEELADCWFKELIWKMMMWKNQVFVCIDK